MRRTFPHRVSDTRRRSASQRREVRLRGRVGIRRRREAACPEQGAADLREHQAVAAELQVTGAMTPTRRVGRRASPAVSGSLVEYTATDVSPDMSFLEMLDVVNERLIASGEVPIALDHD